MGRFGTAVRAAAEKYHANPPFFGPQAKQRSAPQLLKGCQDVSRTKDHPRRFRTGRLWCDVLLGERHCRRKTRRRLPAGKPQGRHRLVLDWRRCVGGSCSRYANALTRRSSISTSTTSTPFIA